MILCFVEGGVENKKRVKTNMPTIYCWMKLVYVIHLFSSLLLIIKCMHIQSFRTLNMLMQGFWS